MSEKLFNVRHVVPQASHQPYIYVGFESTCGDLTTISGEERFEAPVRLAQIMKKWPTKHARILESF